MSGNIGDGEVTYTIENDTGSATIEGDILKPITAGRVWVTAYVSDTSNTYAAQSERTEITIEKAVAPIVIENESIEYGERTKLVVTNNTEFGILTYGICANSHTHEDGTYHYWPYGRATIDEDGYLTGTQSGTICVWVTYQETKSYKTTTIWKSLPVTPRVIELGWSNLEVTYDGNPHSPTVWVKNPVGNDSVCILVYSGNGPIDAGVYQVTAWIHSHNWWVDRNYTLSGVNATNTFTIGRAALTDVDLKEKVTTIDKDLKLELINNHGNGGVTYKILNDTGSAVLWEEDEILHPLVIGKVRVEFVIEETKNYAEYRAEGDNAVIVDIGKRYAPLALKNRSTMYGTNLKIEVQGPAEATLSYRVEGITGDGYILGDLLVPTKAGTVKLYVTSIETKDYQQTTVEYEIEILPIPVILEWDSNTLEFQYDGEAHVPSARVTNLLDGDECEVTPAGAQVNAGTHVASGGMLSNPNYTLTGATNATQEFRIVRNQIEIEITSTQAVWGTPLQLELSGNLGNGKVTWSVENGSGSATISGSVLTATNVGYVIVTAHVAASMNFDEATTQATVTINKISPDIGFTTENLYYGTPFELSITGNEESGNVTYSIVQNSDGTGGQAEMQDDGVTILPIQTGTITITVRVEGTPHYESAMISKTFSILPKPVKLEWTMPEDGFRYNKTEQAPEARVVNTVFGDECTVIIRGEVNANEHAIARAIGTSNPNYTVEGGEEIEKEFAILPRIAELSWDNLVWEYNGTERRPTATVTNICEGDECTVLVVGAKDAGIRTGTAVHLSNVNYTLSEEADGNSTLFEITALKAEFEWGETKLTYNGEEQCPEIRITNLCDGDEVEFTFEGKERNTNKLTGEPYYVAVLTELSNPNYALTAGVSTQYTIEQLELEFSWGALRLEYNGSEQVPEYEFLNAVENDRIFLDFSSKGKDVGSYTVVVSVNGAEAANYMIKLSEAAVRYEIYAKKITVKVKSRNVFAVYTGQAVTLPDDWYGFISDDITGADAELSIEELFNTSGVVVQARIKQNGTVVTPIEKGDYILEPVIIGGTLTGNNNYEVTFGVSEDYGTLKVDAPKSLQLKDGTIAQYITEIEEDEDGDIYSYRRTYAELGWVHGVDDTELERYVIGQVSPETSIMTFMSNFEESQWSMIRLKDSDGNILYDRGKPGEGITEDDLNDTEMYQMCTGYKIEYGVDETGGEEIYISVLGDVNGDGYLDTADNISVLSYIRRVLELDKAEYKLAAYVVNSGEIGTSDAIALLSIIRRVTDIKDHYYIPNQSA